LEEYKKMMTREHKELAHWALNFALEKGCSDACVKIYAETENAFEYRNTQLDKLEQSAGNGLVIKVYVDGKYASFSTNRMEKRELQKFIANGIETTRFLEKDEFRKLPDPARLYKGDGKGLDLYDPQINEVSVDDKLALIKNAAGEVYGADERLISVTAGYSDGEESSYHIASNGFAGETEATWFSLSAETSLKGNSDARPESYWYDSTIYWNKLRKKGIAQTAYDRTVRKLGQEKIKSGVFPMLVDNFSIRRLLSPLISAMYGNAIQQKSSFLAEKLGQKIISDRISLIDDPHIPNAQGARWFDDEGVATHKADIIKRGVLEMFFLDTYYAAKLEMKPTVQSPSVLTVAPGTRDFAQILATLSEGVWITGFNGGNSNGTTGDFSYGVEGFLVKNGEPIKPVNEMNITGNLLSLWQKIVEVGNDPLLISSWRLPCILFEGVSFSGK
jgi:PmbA protein